MVANRTRRARDLRSHLTDAEQALWQRLRNRQLLGFKVRRQVPIGPYVVDFLIPEARLVIEADGGQHLESSVDEQRTLWLEAQGWSVLRFWNNDILTNIDGVLTAIATALQKPSPR
jgi:very-short-patch-repair endonuclease